MLWRIEKSQGRVLALLALILAGWALAGRWDIWEQKQAPPTMSKYWVEIEVNDISKLYAFSRPPGLKAVYQAIGRPWPEDRGDVVLPVPCRVLFQAGAGEPVIKAVSGAAALALGQRINLNEAAVSDLILIDGVGPWTAERIINNRTARGKFCSVDDLARVEGVGWKTIDLIRPYVMVEEGKNRIHIDPGNVKVKP